ncbi:MAG: hypothetical protein JXR64_11005 [Spirochaetales bacterium]|nr:hypothetical protein [Spirochaetales bacterium]
MILNSKYKKYLFLSFIVFILLNVIITLIFYLRSSASNGMIYPITLILLSFLYFIFILFNANKILSKINESISTAKKLSSGDLSTKVVTSDKSEIDQFNQALEDLRKNLSNIAQSLQSNSTDISITTKQLVEGNKNLTERTNTQASSVEQTSSAIIQMNSSIKSNADNTRLADQLSRDALDKTNNGTSAVNSMIKSMNDINKSSDKISDIILVMNNIAFQTNLLALNASIEAARAGEHGKGFGVVAVEVRKLAKRSDKAAKEIADIIKDSNKKVIEGVEIATNAGEMLDQISVAVKKVTALVSEISASSHEQLSSADLIDKTISEFDSTAQENAHLAKEATSSTSKLLDLSFNLNELLNFFKTEKTKETVTKEMKKVVTPEVKVKKPEVKIAVNPEVKIKKPEVKIAVNPEVKIKKPVVKNEPKSEAYEIFSEMADSSDFSEF